MAPEPIQRSFEHSLRRVIDGRIQRVAGIERGTMAAPAAVGLVDMRAVLSRGWWTRAGWGESFEALVAAGNFQGGL